MAKCDSCHIWYHHHCMDIPSEVFGESEVHWECKRCVKTLTPLAGPAQCVTLTPTVCWKFLRATTSITDKKLICRFGVIREEVATICVRNFLLTEGKVYKFMFIPVLFCLVLMFLLKHFHRYFSSSANLSWKVTRVYRAEDTGGHCGRKWVLYQCRPVCVCVSLRQI